MKAWPSSAVAAVSVTVAPRSTTAAQVAGPTHGPAGEVTVTSAAAVMVSVCWRTNATATVASAATAVVQVGPALVQAPAKPPPREPAAGAWVSVIGPWSTVSVQSALQAPTPATSTLPAPLPVRSSVTWRWRTNPARTARAPAIATTHCAPPAPPTLSQPVHPAKRLPTVGVAVIVTDAPAS